MHTQGPFKHHPTKGPFAGLSGPFVITDRDGRPLATMEGWGDAKQEADAKLLASAPTLAHTLWAVHNLLEIADIDPARLPHLAAQAKDLARLALQGAVDANLQ